MEGRFSEATASVVARAEEEAERIGSGFIGTEHLLLGLLGGDRNRANEALLVAGATLDGCRSKVAELVGPTIAATTRSALDLSDRARRTLERSDRLALRLRAAKVEPEHVLVSLLDVEGRAGQVLRSFGVDVAALRLAASSETKVSPEPAPQPDADADASGPRCSSCGADLGDGGLAHTVLNSENADGKSREFVVVYCSGCGASIGASPLPPRQR